jgi:hypothetical protein
MVENLHQAVHVTLLERAYMSEYSEGLKITDKKELVCTRKKESSL